MRLLHWFVGVCLGVILGISMLLIGGITVNATPPPACPGCAVLTHPSNECNEAVQGGWICG